MTKPTELEEKFWKALKSDMTMMLGIAGADEAHTRPMTAQLEGDEGGPIWFFTAKDTDLVQQLSGNDRAIATWPPRATICSQRFTAAFAWTPTGTSLI